MNRVVLLAALVLAACGKDSSGPQQPGIDPPATVHVVNQSPVTDWSAYTIILGADAAHSGVALQGSVIPGGTTCLRSGSVTGERQFIQAAVISGSRLDSAIQAQHGLPIAGNVQTFLTAVPGLVSSSAAYDPAPAGWDPNVTVPWVWTVHADSVSTVAVDTSDHACPP